MPNYDHDLHAFIERAGETLAEEYERIRKRAGEDPGTAGDQGEENWATLLRQWLPEKYRIVTKGRIIGSDGRASPQVDIIILSPSYPPLLDSLKLYMAEGVVAAFECKLTLKSAHIVEAAHTSKFIRGLYPPRRGTPYKELHSQIIYGILAHSHQWKSENSKPVDLIHEKLLDCAIKFAEHPRELIDFVCVADLGFWTLSKETQAGVNKSLLNPVFFEHQPYMGECKMFTFYFCNEIEIRDTRKANTPVGTFLMRLYTAMAWSDLDMRWLPNYFGQVLGGYGSSKMGRKWMQSVYSEEVENKVFNGFVTTGDRWSEWAIFFC